MNKRKVLVGLLCMVMGAGTASATWFNAYASGDWDGLFWGSGDGNGIIPPESDDDVYLDNDHTVALNVDSTVNSLVIARDTPAGTFATLNVNAGKVITVNNVTRLGTATAGTIGTLNVTDGTFVAKGATIISANSMVDINGGSFTVDNAAGSVGMNGAGLLKLQSGTFSTTAVGDAITATFANNFEISGGTVNIGNQSLFTGELKVVGDAAIISLDYLNNNAGANGDFVFEMGTSGVSMIDGTGSWMHLGSSTIEVDGSAYTGGTGTFTLFRSSNLASMSTDIANVSGFTGGLSGTIAQDGNDVVLTVIPEPATLGLITAFGGGLLFIRRMFQI